MSAPSPWQPPDRPASSVHAGEVRGHAVQAGSISGNVHIHGPTWEPPRVVHYSPPPRMIDRSHMLRALRNQVAEGRSVLTWTTLHGDPGVGKSALALAFLRDIRETENDSGLRFPGGLLQVRPARTGVRRALWEALETFGITQRDLPPGTEPSRALHAEIERRGAVAILVDGAQDINEVWPFVPSTEGSLLIVAGARDAAAPEPDAVAMDGGSIEDRLAHLEAHELHVPPLALEDAVALLQREASAEWTNPEHQALAVRVCDAVGRLPYLLRAYGRLIRRLDEGQGEKNGLRRFGEEFFRAVLDPADPGSAVEMGYEVDVAARAYLRDQSPEVAAFILDLAAHPDAPFSTELAHRLADAPAARVDEWLAELTEGGLLRRVPGGGEDTSTCPVGYEFHSGQVLAALRIRGASRGSAAMNTISAYYLDLARAAHNVLLPGRPLEDVGADHPTGKPDPPHLDTERHAGERLDRERAALTQVVHDAVRLGRQVHPGYLRVAYRLVAALWAYWFPRGLMDEIVDTHDALILAAANGGLAPSERAQLFLQRSIARRRERDLFTARADAERAIELAEQSPAIPLALHSALEARGDVHLDAGETSDSIRLFTHSLAIAVELPPRQRPRAVLNLTHKLGRAHLADGDLGAARGLLELSAWAVGQLDHQSRPAGIVADRDGGPPHWVASAVQCLDHDDPQNLARLTTSLGDLAWAEGDPVGTNRHWSEALEIHRRAGHLRRAAELLERRADTLHTHDSAAAGADLDAARDLYSHVGAVLPWRRVTRRRAELAIPENP